VAGIANTTLGSSAEVVEQAPEPSSAAIPEPREKKVKKEKHQRQKKISLDLRTRPSPSEEEKEVKLPLYWRQYCDPRKLIKLVERAGFELVRTKGSHQIFIKKVEDGSIAFSLPYHSAEDIDPGLARKILLLIMKFIVIE
jgi:predicted RNA binding protein YcfA (HicA-like mRNA interferase family)